MAVIENIDFLEEAIVPLFLRLGRKHVAVPDFEVKYFKVSTLSPKLMKKMMRLIYCKHLTFNTHKNYFEDDNLY